MSDLFAERRERLRRGAEPLAVRMRPRTLGEFVGQEHFLGQGRLLRRMLEADRMTSVIFYGPPGTGKTTLAELIARYTRRRFERANAVAVGVKQVREVLERAMKHLEADGTRTIFFLDEIHRFNRAQQDVLLGDVERGIITLIGATTENPFFAVNSPLISRSQVFAFEPLNEQQIRRVIAQALADKQRGLGGLNIQISDEALAHWATMCDGDARRALMALEIAVLSGGARGSGVGGGVSGLGSGGSGVGGKEDVDRDVQRDGEDTQRDDEDAQRDDNEKPETRDAILSEASPKAAQPAALAESGEPGAPIIIDLQTAEQSIQQKALVYDGTGDEHYDTISALIKSMRGSDPDATVYWLARMLEAGEDPMFLARRIAILASEDIGNADPQAIQVAAAAYEIAHRIGMPECRITLAQAAIYMATAPKSNASYVAIDAAISDVKQGRTVPVPKHLMSATRMEKEKLGHGKGYQYAHDGEGGYVAQEYLGVDKQYYKPTDRGYEKMIGKYLAWVREKAEEKRH